MRTYYKNNFIRAAQKTTAFWGSPCTLHPNIVYALSGLLQVNFPSTCGTAESVRPR